MGGNRLGSRAQLEIDCEAHVESALRELCACISSQTADVSQSDVGEQSLLISEGREVSRSRVQLERANSERLKLLPGLSGPIG